MKVPRHTPESEFYRDADGYDIAQDSRWNEVDPSMFYDDPSLADWPRPRRSLLKSPIHREDFDPTGLPPLLGVVPASTDCRGNTPQDAPVSSRRRVHSS